MGDEDSVEALAVHEPATPVVVGSAVELVAPRRLTPSFLVGAIILMVALTATTIACIVAGLLGFLGFLHEPMGRLVGLELLALGVFGGALCWRALYKSVVARVRPPDLSEVALPDAFWRLSPRLRRLLEETRASREALRDPEIGYDELLDELNNWLNSVASVSGNDADVLAHRGLDGERLRPVVVAICDREDIQPRTLALLDDYEARLLDEGLGPYR
ncbi:MAG: hypothetical protein R3B09_06735 [Nannocystaceae bacterium]